MTVVILTRKGPVVPELEMEAIIMPVISSNAERDQGKLTSEAATA